MAGEFLVVFTVVLALCVGNVWASKYEGIPDEALPTASGYLTVNSRGARIFYIYYEAQSPEGELGETPIVLWLQGGPGCSGLVGSFFEFGPWMIADDQKFYPNDASWNRLYGVLFIDQPVGTGFSEAPNKGDVPDSEEATSRDIYIALDAFFTQQSFQSRPLYATGESYAGKYVPGLGYYYLQQKAAGVNPSFELKGLAIGNSLTDPIRQIPVYAPAAHYMGLIEADEIPELDEMAAGVVAAIEEGRFDLAHDWRSKLMRRLSNLTQLATLLDIRRGLDYYMYPNGTDWLSVVLNKPSVRHALGVKGDRKWEDCTDFVDDAFRNLTMRSAKFMVEAALTHLPVLLYQGQFDLQDGVASNEAWIRHLNWSGIEQFWKNPRQVWTLQGETAGYIRSHENLANVVILGAGHLVPADQGLRSQKMIEAWISGSLSSLHGPPRTAGGNNGLTSRPLRTGGGNNGLTNLASE